VTEAEADGAKLVDAICSKGGGIGGAEGVE